MSIIESTLPRFGRPDADLAVMSYSTVSAPTGEDEAAQMVRALWDVWPRGLVSHHVYAETAGHGVMSYAQWRDEAAYDASVSTRSPAVLRLHPDVVIAPEGVERLRFDRSMPGADARAAPGCIVIVTFAVSGPDRQRELIDRVIATAQAQPGGADEPIASHFHRSLDGRKVINYAELRDEATHEALVRRALSPGSPVIRMLSALEGVEPLGFRRFLPVAGLERITQEVSR